jgi:hypothetical protein
MRNLSALAAAAVAAAVMAASPAAAHSGPAAEVVFKAGSPEAIAPRLASECTRRRMALIRNTPERVVCKRVAAKASGGHIVSELWSFALDRMSRGRTKVQARPSFEAATANGYAVLSLSEVPPESRLAMRGFMEDVRDRGPTP